MPRKQPGVPASKAIAAAVRILGLERPEERGLNERIQLAGLFGQLLAHGQMSEDNYAVAMTWLTDSSGEQMDAMWAGLGADEVIAIVEGRN